MKVAIITTMREGVALSKTELLEAPRHGGRLLLEDWTESNLFARPIRRARLVSTLPSVGGIDVVALLFEPDLIKVGDDRLMLVGHEVHAVGKVARHVVQVWLVKPWSDGGQLENSVNA